MVARTFERPPSAFGLYLKAALPAIPVLGAIRGIRHEGRDAPELTLSRPSVTTDAEHLDEYNDVCGFTLADTLPATYPHLASFGLHLALMTDTSFPFAPLGLVHLRNSITQHRPIGVDEAFTVDVFAQRLRPHPKGQIIDIVTESRIGAELVWEETQTLLSRGDTGRGSELARRPLEGVEAPSGVIHWRAPANIGRRYGAVSGDRNPIHLHPVAAKAFGFTTAIAHGMWAKARCLAGLQSQLPGAYRVDVEFRTPIRLPSTIIFGSRRDSHHWVFGVQAKHQPSTHLVGAITAL